MTPPFPRETEWKPGAQRHRHLNPITAQQGYSSASPLANVIHASLNTSNLPKPQDTPATKLRNACSSVHSRDRPSAAPKMARYEGATPKAAALSIRELQLSQLKTTSESSQKNLLPHSLASQQGPQ